jgi:hypothetical protein
MSTLVLVVIIVILLGGLGYGGGLYGGGGNRYWGTAAQPGYGIGGIIGVVIVALILLMLLGVIASPFHTGVTTANRGINADRPTLRHAFMSTWSHDIILTPRPTQQACASRT